LADRISGLEPFAHEAIEKAFREFVEERKIKAGQVIHPARMAVSGKTKGAGLFEMMEVLGRDRVLERLRRAAHG
jgi:glutamyl-tRNA synthetase